MPGSYGTFETQTQQAHKAKPTFWQEAVEKKQDQLPLDGQNAGVSQQQLIQLDIKARLSMDAILADIKNRANNLSYCYNFSDGEQQYRASIEDLVAKIGERFKNYKLELEKLAAGLGDRKQHFVDNNYEQRLKFLDNVKLTLIDLPQLNSFDKPKIINAAFKSMTASMAYKAIDALAKRLWDNHLSNELKSDTAATTPKMKCR